MIVTFLAAARSRAAKRSPRSISRRVARATDKGLPWYLRPTPSVGGAIMAPSLSVPGQRACCQRRSSSAPLACRSLRGKSPTKQHQGSFLEWVGGATAVLDRDPALFGERLDTGGAAELAVAGVPHAAEGGHGLIG